MPFRIGHPSYSGANSPAFAPTYAAALRILLSRRVPMLYAHRALRNARQGSHACCSRYSHGIAVESIEVVTC